MVGDRRSLRDAHPLLVVSSPRPHGAAVAAWVREALDRGQRVLCTHAPTPDAVQQLDGWLTEAGLCSHDREAGGRLGLLDAGWLRATSGGGRSDRLRTIYIDLVARARAEGFTGVAVTGDAAALRASTADEQQLRAHERDLDVLTRQLPLRALCRYPEHEPAQLLTHMLELHHHAVADQHCDLAVVEGCVWVNGELDAGNAERLSAVLHGAIRAGITTVDLSEIGFFSAAALQVLAAAADTTGPDAQLVLRNPAPQLARIAELTGLTHHPGITWTSTE